MRLRNSGFNHAIHNFRGLAALAVCLFHFVSKTKDFLEDTILGELCNYGHYGVEVFFTISGFVIVKNLNESSYSLSHFWKYFKKRLIRLEPPYLVSLFCLLLVSAVIIEYKGQAWSEFPDLTNILLHIGYLIPVQISPHSLEGYNWLSPVYWTLGIEFQFYIIMALVFPVFKKYQYGALVFMGLMAILKLIWHFNPEHQYLLSSHFQFFTLGIAAYLIANYRNPADLVIFGLILIINFYWGWSWILLFNGLMVLLFLFLPNIKLKGFYFLGTVSYSLYLFHAVVGTPLLNYTSHYAKTFPEKLLVLVTVLAITLGLSYTIYLFVERPSMRWSKRISYKE
ncbi:MAG: acyltransferase family protein [Luteibaculum sp.]